MWTQWPRRYTRVVLFHSLVLVLDRGKDISASTPQGSGRALEFPSDETGPLFLTCWCVGLMTVFMGFRGMTGSELSGAEACGLCRSSGQLLVSAGRGAGAWVVGWWRILQMFIQHLCTSGQSLHQVGM